jgi:hypothetical protein
MKVEIGGLEDFGPRQSGADTQRGATQRAHHQTQQPEQRNFHDNIFANIDVARRNSSRLVAARTVEVQYGFKK